MAILRHVRTVQELNAIVVCFWLVLCVICYVLRGALCVMRGGSFSCASSPAELWPLSNLPGRVLDGVSCTHRTYS